MHIYSESGNDVHLRQDLVSEDHVWAVLSRSVLLGAGQRTSIVPLFEKTFDRLHNGILGDTLKRKKLPDKIVNLIEAQPRQPD